MTLNNTPKGSNFVDWKSTLYFVIRRRACPGLDPGPESRFLLALQHERRWMPACAGMTNLRSP
jgi:hypothetical protein